jgi:hypothetical protein
MRVGIHMDGRLGNLAGTVIAGGHGLPRDRHAGGFEEFRCQATGRGRDVVDRRVYMRHRTSLE